MHLKKNKKKNYIWDSPTKDVMMAPEQDATICWSGVMPLLAKGAELWPFMLLSWKARFQF